MVYYIKRRILHVMILICASLVLFLAAAQDNSIANHFQEEIQNRVGDDDVIPVVFLCPETGFYSFVGQDAAWAARYAVDRINEEGGINGHKVELILKDTESDKSLAVSYFAGAAREVPAVIGPLDAPSSAQIAQMLDGMYTTSIASYAYEQVRQQYGSFAVAFMSDSSWGECQAVRVWKEKNPDIKDIVIFTDSEDEAKADSVRLLQTEAADMGIRILDVVDVSGERTELHYEQCAIQALNKKADGYISLLVANDYAQILKELRTRGVTEGRRITSSFAAFSSDLLSSSGKNLDGTYIWDKFDISYKGVQWRELSEAYQRTHDGRLPMNNTISDIYNAVQALCQCYEELGLDGKNADEQERRKVNEWFYNSPVIHGIQGDFRWEKGQKISDYHFFIFYDDMIHKVS